MSNKEKALRNFLQQETQTEDGYEEVCDIKTGQCYTLKTKDGLIERVDKRYVVEDGRSLLRG